MVGGAFGVALLGSILNAAYQRGLHRSGLPAAAASTVRTSVFGGLAVGQQLHSPSLVAGVKAAFTSGMDLVLIVCGGIATAGALLELALLPQRATETRASEAGRAQVAEAHVPVAS
jgi:hypothetical protein